MIDERVKFKCDRCGRYFPVNELTFISCEGLFCEPCDIAMLEASIGIPDDFSNRVLCEIND